MTVVVLTSGTSWTALAGTLTLVEAWGGGGVNSSNAGGGGGAYTSLASVTVTNGASIPIQIGSDSTPTKFNTTTVIADSGFSANASGNGLAANCTPSIGAFSGGNTQFVTGGGGCAGPDGAGGGGVVNGAGGAGDNSLGGAGGANGTSGSNGVSNVLGGGGGGFGSGGSGTGGTGGVPGGGAGYGSIVGAFGGGGQIRITYSSVTAGPLPYQPWQQRAPLMAT